MAKPVKRGQTGHNKLPPVATDCGATQVAETYLSNTQLAARYGVNRSTVWRWSQTDPTFPKPVSLSPGCTRWKLSALEAWEAAKAKRGTAA